MALPGVKVGPLDPDATSDFGQVSQKNSARTLIRLHAQQHPPILRKHLRRALDPERTKGLDMDEVRDYLSGLKHDNGDPIVPKGAVVVGASVRGEQDEPQTLTFTYRTGKSGRTAKWFAPYSENELPESFKAGSEYRRVREMKDRGVVEFDREGLRTQVLEREAGSLRRENGALRAQVEGQGGGDLPDEVEGDTRPDDRIAADNEELGRENEELKARVAQLEQLTSNLGELPPSPGASGRFDPDAKHQTIAQEPPVEGYDDLRGDELIKIVKADDTSEEQRQAILDYEKGHQNRRGVVGAAEQSLGKGD